MSLDLHLHEVVPRETHCPTCEVINVQDFPVEFKEKFADYLYDLDVSVIDWEQTIQKIVGMEYRSFCEDFELVLETDDQFFFAPKNNTNPLDSPELITIRAVETVRQILRHPHVTINRLGYQRKGMKDAFFNKFSNNQVIIDLEVARSMLSLCDNVDSMENFSENFVSNWTDTSFLMVQF